ncbi:MAG: 2-oxoacid:acceptor oxidoreductase family protein [Deltaproteobacteria bacterium]|nr:2-oxoacid:acceptor oxidoreductase family protein [Deltaproteobacteria bacterium]
MIEVMFQGEGGHGSVVAAKLLAQAAARSGFHAQSFASYGALRRGGKVEGYVRISEEKLLLHCKMYIADYLVIMDESLFDETATAGAIKNNGKILVNTSKAKVDFPALADFDVTTVDAYRIAREQGLVIPGGMPVINTTLLGALTAMLDIIPVEDLIEVIKTNTPKSDQNAACAEEGYQHAIAASESKRSMTPPTIDGAAGSADMKRFPVYDTERMKRCHTCQICFMVCPSLAISFEGDPIRFEVNRAVCTGCGICIEECPREAIYWEGKKND